MLRLNFIRINNVFIFHTFLLMGENIIYYLSFISLFFFPKLQAQPHLIIPRKGVEGVPVVLDSSRAEDVVHYFGNDFQIYEDRMCRYYRYPSLGLTFRFDPLDRNRIIRAIILEAPFSARTREGVELNRSTIQDVWNIYGEEHYVSGVSRAWYLKNGIYFHVHIPPGQKRIPPGAIIYKIAVSTDDDSGMPSRKNFVFDQRVVQGKLNELIKILEIRPFDTVKWEKFWQEQKEKEHTPAGMRKWDIIRRRIEYGLTQTFMEIWIAGNFYTLNMVRSGASHVYIRLEDANKEKVIYERKEDPRFAREDFRLYVYGVACGPGGSPPPLMQKMIDEVNTGRYERLSEWLHSLNPELAAYGYTGLSFLRMKGRPIKPADSLRMARLKELDIPLNICNGCTGKKKKMSRMLNEKELYQMYQTLNNTGWLKEIPNPNLNIR